MENADQIAKLCLQQYNSFGTRGAKPRIRQDGRFEWTVLAGIVLSIKSSEWHCISLATGVKALPFSHLSKHGDLLHDSHAEVLARRAARHWLLQRLLDESEDSTSSQPKGISRIFLKNDKFLPFGLCEDAHLHLYCSTLPCGDMSSSLIISEQQESNIQTPSISVLRGRVMSSSSQIYIRTKPGRPQAEPSISMSCSDKIANWTLMGIQGALLYGIMGKIPLKSYVIGNQAFVNQSNVLENCQKILQKKCGNYPIPQIMFTGCPFLHSRESVEEDLLKYRPDACVSGPSDDQDLVPSANSLIWCLGAKPQGVVEGHRQGAALRRSAGEPLRQSSRSTFCKLQWFRFFCEVQKRLAMQQVSNAIYYKCKEDIPQYRQQKHLLRGTSEMNDIDRLAYQHEAINAFLEQQQSNSRSWPIQDEAPFAGWLVSSPLLEQFDLNGHEIIQNVVQ